MKNISQYLIVFVFCLPLFSLILQGVTYPFLRFRIPEKVIRIYFNATGIISIFLTLLLFYTGVPSQISYVGYIFHLSSGFQNLAISLGSLVLLGVTSHFSFDYIHKEKGFYKFFLNFNLFWLGIILFIWSKNDFLLFAGWELIGISSIFLIAFYDYRKGPIESSIIVTAYYKVGDILLITSLLSLTHLGSNYSVGSYIITNVAYFGIIIAGLIKSGSFPFTSWLPRAMEGPTPSSAVYYSALAVNTGLLLLIKKSDVILALPIHQNSLLLFGGITIVYSGIIARVQTDAKNSLVYASSFQTGFVLVEISLGWNDFALFHMFSNSLLKTYQFLRTPTYLYTYNKMQGYYGKVFEVQGRIFLFFIPKRVQKFLYKLSFNHFFVDDFFLQLSQLTSALASIARSLLLPITSFNKKEKNKILTWLLYFIVGTFLIDKNAFEIHKQFVDYIPFVLLFIALALYTSKDVFEFIATFIIYRLFEQMVVHTVHIYEPLKMISLIMVVIFVGLLFINYKASFGRKNRSLQTLIKTLTIFVMLYFTNFPFLLQSLMNEHLIEHFLENQNLLNLFIYAGANTIMNIALFRKVFSFVYFDENIGGSSNA